MNIRYSFRYKLTLLFILISFFVALVSSYIFYYTLSEIEDEKYKTFFSFLSNIASSYILPYIPDNPEFTPNSRQIAVLRGKLKDILSADNKINYVYLIFRDKSGNVFYFTDAGRVGNFSVKFKTPYLRNNKEKVSLIFDKKESDYLIDKTFGKLYSSIFIPLKKNGNVAVVLGIDMSNSSILNYQRKIRNSFFAVIPISVIFALVLGILASDMLIRPLGKLLKGTERLSGGDYDFRLNVKVNDEFKLLAEAFNNMAVSIKNSNRRIKRAFLDTIRALTAALEAKDPYTKGHSERVMKYGIAIAREMGIDEDVIENLKYLYILHDIGKIGIDENILNKPEMLSEDERRIILEHSKIGGDIIAPISFMDKDLIKIVTSHHERQDGKGYPKGLKGNEIPLSVAILTVADAFDAMVTDRPYRKAHDIEYAKKELLKYVGTQFRRDVVEAFLRVLERGNPLDL